MGIPGFSADCALARSQYFYCSRQAHNEKDSSRGIRPALFATADWQDCMGSCLPEDPSKSKEAWPYCSDFCDMFASSSPGGFGVGGGYSGGYRGPALCPNRMDCMDSCDSRFPPGPQGNACRSACRKGPC